MENECCCKSNSNSGFIFGLICGAVIGAVIAVLIYKNNKTEVFENLQEKIKHFFQDLMGEESVPKKIIVVKTDPVSIVSMPRKIKPAPKMFVKAKK
ncbi:MAG: hypothetical protein WC895_01660 [Candidatus Shapirobacteria bacterium]|jgi:hypothetical protein